MVLEQVSHLPEDMISHHAAVRSNKLKVPKPINGLEVLYTLACSVWALSVSVSWRGEETIFSYCQCWQCWGKGNEMNLQNCRFSATFPKHILSS
jgi:hypothetical protein